MTGEPFKDIKSTFPWKAVTTLHPIGGVVTIYDKDGKEVPITHITRLLEAITLHLSKEKQDGSV